MRDIHDKSSNSVTPTDTGTDQSTGDSSPSYIYPKSSQDMQLK